MKRCLFVAPDPAGAITGGNLFNLRLITALRTGGVAVERVDREHRRDVSAPDAHDTFCIVDSLYLEELPRFGPCWVLLHYLPSLVEGRDCLSAIERAALLAADGIVVPSPFMATVAAQRAPAPRPIVVVAPGLELSHHAMQRTSRAVVVANVVRGKGVLEFLRALGGRRLPLSIIGALDRDPDYASACRSAAEQRDDIEFLGERTPEETLAHVAASDFLVSPSRMESFGLALAEARALGTPIVALDRGNASAHVDEAAGGALASSNDALADACVRLAGDRTEIARRRSAALAHRTAPRSWAEAAEDFARLLGPPRADVSTDH